MNDINDNMVTESVPTYNNNVYFTAKGEITNNVTPDVVAKQLEAPNGNFNYEIKININGVPFNPHDKHYITETKRLSKIEGRQPFSMARITKAGFDSYIKFLKYGNNFDLRKAQKELR